MSVTGALYEITAEEHEAIRADPQKARAVLIAGGGHRFLDLGKDWHALDFLLNRIAPSSVDALIVRGVSIGNVGDHECGLLSPDYVAMAADGLCGNPKESLLSEMRGAFDARAMDAAGVYPSIWARDGDAARDGVLATYARLIDWLDPVADRRAALLCVVGP